MKTTAQNRPKRHRCSESEIAIVWIYVSSCVWLSRSIWAMWRCWYRYFRKQIYYSLSKLWFELNVCLCCVLTAAAFHSSYVYIDSPPISDRIIEMIWQFFDRLSQEQIENFNFHSYLTPNTRILWVIHHPAPNHCDFYRREQNSCGYALFSPHRNSKN